MESMILLMQFLIHNVKINLVLKQLTGIKTLPLFVLINTLKCQKDIIKEDKTEIININHKKYSSQKEINLVNDAFLYSNCYKLNGLFFLQT